MYNLYKPSLYKHSVETQLKESPRDIKAQQSPIFTSYADFYTFLIG